MRFDRCVLLVGAALALAGCQQSQSVAVKPVPQTAALGLRVSDVLVDDVTLASTDASRIEGKLLPTPADALRDALVGHYQPGLKGQNGAPVLRFTIKTAEVTETKLPPPEEGMERLLRKKPDTRYDGHVLVEAQLGASGISRGGFVMAEVHRELEVANVSGDERMKLLNNMVALMVADTVNQLDSQINTNLGGILATAASSGTGITVVPQPSGRWDTVHNWK